MRKIFNNIFYIFLCVFTLITIISLIFVILFITKEALPTFKEVSLMEFLFGRKWMPVEGISDNPGFGIFNFIAATIYVSILAMFIAVSIGLGAAIYLSCIASERLRTVMYPFIDLLAGIPSVVYGFVGLNVLVKIFLKAGVHTGNCVLAAAIVLSVMLLPYLVSSSSDTLLKNKELYLSAGNALGVEKWYTIASVILPASLKNILTAMILAIGRAMGETMAVMMVMGNANLFPHILGKGESIASVIALEMGTAVSGSTHFHALYASGLVLVVILLLINILIGMLRRKLVR
ncbi:phosphate ABC transporter, permease protein PstC [Lachnospiraceae bacterium JC7]|nr:phosphate ABC transporter, permease protein PstC [Lachnospiraceae bacterium JC7]